MTLDYSTNGQVKVLTISHMQVTISTFSEVIQVLAATQAEDYLFQVRDSPQPTFILSEEQVMAFHHTIYKLLFISAQVRWDKQTPVASLTT